MQLNGALRGGASTIPWRGRLRVLLAILAIVVIAAMVALVGWAAPIASNEIGTEEANPNSAGAGSSVVTHDDPWNLPRSNAGSAVIHDDAGDVHPRLG
jgi:hypothetical protein